MHASTFSNIRGSVVVGQIVISFPAWGDAATWRGTWENYHQWNSARNMANILVVDDEHGIRDLLSNPQRRKTLR